MRAPNVSLLHETVSICFDQVLTTLGERTKNVIYAYLSRRGIQNQDISSKFEDVERLLVELYGQGGRSVLVGTLAKLCDEYSTTLNLGYSDSLSNRLMQLSEEILSQKLVPKRYRGSVETRMFEDKTGVYASWTD